MAISMFNTQNLVQRISDDCILSAMRGNFISSLCSMAVSRWTNLIIPILVAPNLVTEIPEHIHKIINISNSAENTTSKIMRTATAILCTGTSALCQVGIYVLGLASPEIIFSGLKAHYGPLFLETLCASMSFEHRSPLFLQDRFNMASDVFSDIIKNPRNCSDQTISQRIGRKALTLFPS